MKIQQDRRPGHGRALDDRGVQRTRACRRLPVDAAERVARLIGAYAGDPGGVFVESMSESHLADGPARRQVVTGQADDARQDEQEGWVGGHAEAAVQAEEVAGL